MADPSSDFTYPTFFAWVKTPRIRALEVKVAHLEEKVSRLSGKVAELGSLNSQSRNTIEIYKKQITCLSTLLVGVAHKGNKIVYRLTDNIPAFISISKINPFTGPDFSEEEGCRICPALL